MLSHDPSPHEEPGDLHGYCPMTKDELLDDQCTCPDPVIVSRTWLRHPFSNSTFRLECNCCRLPIDSESFNRSPA